ncbi:Origin recognition complex subunit 2, partial [Operophtera brumata]
MSGGGGFRLHFAVHPTNKAQGTGSALDSALKSSMDSNPNITVAAGTGDQEMAASPSRRTCRVRTKPKKYGDFLESTPNKRRSYKDYDSTDDEIDEEFSEQTVKPTDLQNKVNSVISNTPKVTDSPKTPRKTVLSRARQNSTSKVCEATPRHSSQSSEADNSSDAEEEPRKSVEKVLFSKNKPNRNKLKDSELNNLNLENESQDIQLSNEHQTKLMELNNTYSSLFNRWLYVLSENFNIILYGIGSKRTVLHQFQTEKLSDFPCIVVNGFFPSLTIKSIIESIVVDLLENTHVPSNVGDVVNLIDTQLTEKGVDVFLIIHNIDGAMLRNAKAQATLASLSQIRNFTWWDVTTLMPYSAETSFESSLMGARSGALQLSSLRSFLVSSDLALRAQLTEFLDHKLVRMKRTYDGSENFIIPIENTLLHQFLEQQKS